MAKKIKFPLKMKSNAQVRTIEDLREHFDLTKAVEYFLNGKLLIWLEARCYDKEANAIKKMNKDEAQLHQKLCSIFGVEYTEQDAPANMEEVEERNLRLARLKQYTSDETILSHVDHVAFDQEELSDLLDENIHDIYLCSNSFSIPLRFENKKYIGIGKVEAVINSSERVDFSSIGIEFENIQFDSGYEKKAHSYESSSLNRILDAISSQRWYFFKNKKKIMFDRNSGLVWPNLDYFQYWKSSYNGLIYYNTCNDGYIEINPIINEINDKGLLDAYPGWRIPELDEFRNLICDKTYPFFEEDPVYGPEIKGGCYDGGSYWCVNNGGRYSAFILKTNSVVCPHCVAVLPCSSCMTTEDYAKNVMPANRVYTDSEKMNFTLEMFVKNNLFPIFYDEEITELYAKNYMKIPDEIFSLWKVLQ